MRLKYCALPHAPLMLPSLLSGRWLFGLAVSVCAAATTFWPDGLALLRYDRDAIVSGQIWRLLTGHVVHLNTWHLTLNLLGLWLIAELLCDRVPARYAAGSLLLSALLIDLALWTAHPDIGWYAGLSGALHGLWAGCALRSCLLVFMHEQSLDKKQGAEQGATTAWWKTRQASVVGVAGLLLLVAKLALEGWHGPSPSSVEAIGSPIIVVAHLYGAVAGSLYCLAWSIIALLRARLHRRTDFD
jgi:rhomboid family GlyGly-CTERM serine protease